VALRAMRGESAQEWWAMKVIPTLMDKA
jgi:hypothetical protein